MDYYKVLGVNESSSQDDIKKAYRKLSLKHHPDRGGNGEEFKKINEAYSILGDVEKRRMYKMQSANPFAQMNGVSPGDMDPLFKMFFGGGFPGMQGGIPGMQGGIPGMPHVQIFRNGQPVNMHTMQKPASIIKNVVITLEQSYAGLTYPLQIERWILINNVKRMEKEKLYINISKGVDTGEIMIIKDKGNIINDRLKGDIKLHIKVENKTHMKREGLNLVYKKDITLYMRGLYPTPDWDINNGYQLDKALLFALIRRESAFNLKAKSEKGARGLMQIMPRTASKLENNYRLRYSEAHKLYSLQLNLEIGQKFLKKLMRNSESGNSILDVLISYNAGIKRLKNWKKYIVENDPIVFIESIPIKETRWFVKYILTDLWIYRDRMEQEKPSRTLLANGKWPIYENLDYKLIQDAKFKK